MKAGKLAKALIAKKNTTFKSRRNLLLLDKTIDESTPSRSFNFQYYLNNVLCFGLREQKAVLAQIHTAILKQEVKDSKERKKLEREETGVTCGVTFYLK
jgi:hypothetical protein